MKKYLLLISVVFGSCLKDNTIDNPPIIDRQQFNYSQSWILSEVSFRATPGWNPTETKDTLRFFYNLPDESNFNGGDFSVSKNGILADESFKLPLSGAFYRKEIQHELSFKSKGANDSINLSFKGGQKELILYGFSDNVEFDSLKYKVLE